MTLLSFHGKFVVQSTVQFVTASVLVLVDDTQAIQTFALSGNQTVLAVYQANNNYGSTNTSGGAEHGINVDGVDVAISTDSGINTDNQTIARNTLFWIGTLGAGNHTIKGRVCSNAGGSVTIDNRILLIYILEGTEFQYISSDTDVSSSSGTLVDDTQASVNFTPSSACLALYLYNAARDRESAVVQESPTGKFIAINVAGVDDSVVLQEKSPRALAENDSVFTVFTSSLNAVATTVKGRFASNSAGQIVNITHRQLGVLLFDPNITLSDIVSSNIQVSTSSSALVNDAQALISRSTTDAELLAFVAATKNNGTASQVAGLCYGIMVDSVDRQVSRGSINQNSFADSASTCFAIKFHGTATHTVQGRFSNNLDANTSVVDARRVVALWLEPSIHSALRRYMYLDMIL